jgi:hypothetical protein
MNLPLAPETERLHRFQKRLLHTGAAVFFIGDMIRTCQRLACQKQFKTDQRNRKYCSRACQNAQGWKHGLTHTTEHKIWISMRARCRTAKPNRGEFRNYIARGITVCERWQTFTNFLADMGRRPSPKHTIERRNNNGNYEPSNCYWATMVEQGNNRRDNKLIEFHGEMLTLSRWAVRLRIKRATLQSRLLRG